MIKELNEKDWKIFKEMNFSIFFFFFGNDGCQRRRWDNYDDEVKYQKKKPTTKTKENENQESTQRSCFISFCIGKVQKQANKVQN